MVLPDLLRGDGREADAVGDRARVPRLADAVAVHLADLHVRDHLRRRDGDEGDVAVGIDAAGAEPVAHPHRVRAGRVRHRERHRGALGLGLEGERLELLRRLDALLEERLVQRDGLAVPVEVHGNDHRLHRRALEAHGRRVGHPEQHVGGLVLAERQPVANDRPRRFLRDRRLDAVLLEEAELVRHDDRRAIGERDDAEAHLRCSGASDA